MSGDTTIQMLKRLSWLPEREDGLNGNLIGGQNYDDVFFIGGEIANVDLVNVTIDGNVPGTVTSVGLSGGTTGLTVSGSPVTESGTMTLSGTLDIDNGGTGQTTANAALNALLPAQVGNSGKVLQTDGSNSSWQTNGAVSTVSVVTANGFAGTVANPTTTPAITLTTSVTGVLKGNGTAISAAVAGTDYLTPTGNGSGLTNLTAANISTGTAGISVSGNAGTATALQTARNINGTSFNGTADITVTAAAGTLTGNTLAAGVTASSLTSLGTISTGVWNAGAVTSNGTLSVVGAPINEVLGANIASASTINLDTATGNTVQITGTTTINSIALTAGRRRLLYFQGVLQLTHSVPALVCPGNANINTAAGDMCEVVAINGGVAIFNYQRQANFPA